MGGSSLLFASDIFVNCRQVGMPLLRQRWCGKCPIRTMLSQEKLKGLLWQSESSTQVFHLIQSEYSKYSKISICFRIDPTGSNASRQKLY